MEADTAVIFPRVSPIDDMASRTREKGSVLKPRLVQIVKQEKFIFSATPVFAYDFSLA